MKHFKFRYPGDPTQPAVLMSRREFLVEHPRSPIVVTDLDTGEREEFPIPKDMIVCDVCNDEIEDEVLVIAGSMGYCPKCVAEFKKEYLTPVGVG